MNVPTWQEIENVVYEIFRQPTPVYEIFRQPTPVYEIFRQPAPVYEIFRQPAPVISFVSVTIFMGCRKLQSDVLTISFGLKT